MKLDGKNSFPGLIELDPVNMTHICKAILQSRLLKRALLCHTVLFCTLNVPIMAAPATKPAVVCIEPASVGARIGLALPYLIGSLIFYIVGVIGQIINLVCSLTIIILYVPAFFLDLFIFRWSTGKWFLLDLMGRLYDTVQFMDAYWAFGQRMHDNLWGSC